MRRALRRLDESAEILMVERGPYVSYANCGLPYHVGGVIKEEASLLVATAELFRDRFAIDVRTSCEATEILPKEKKVRLRDVTHRRGERAFLRQAGAVAGRRVHPPAAAGDRPSGHLPRAHRARRAPDQRMDRVAPHRGRNESPRAVVVGGGFIGLEMAENLVHRGFEVTVVEMAGQVLLPADEEFARAVEAHLEKHGVKLRAERRRGRVRAAGGNALKVRHRIRQGP